jgi:acetyl-CoA carboxylase alpha subunit
MSERVIAELQKQIEQLKELSRNGLDLAEEIARLEAKLTALQAPTPSLTELDDWERVKLARHPSAPTPSIISSSLWKTFMSCTATGSTGTTQRSSRGWLASTAKL